ncbi:MAG: DUF5830 family protein, partial [Candidatus Hydrothermarchaeota archaeon]|nr:DUF5830 family protein [Candidatus Hydrothermarchaeota archaeon]
MAGIVSGIYHPNYKAKSAGMVVTRVDPKGTSEGLGFDDPLRDYISAKRILYRAKPGSGRPSEPVERRPLRSVTAPEWLLLGKSPRRSRKPSAEARGSSQILIMDRVEKGLKLLSAIKRMELSVKEATEILEIVTKVPEIIKEILKEGEKKGLIRREKGKVYLTSSDEGLGFESKIKKYECVSHCSRCGRRITSCYYLSIGDEEL